MRKNVLLALSFLIIAVLASVPNLMVSATADFQGGTVGTPTAGPDGRIIYVVQPNDSCWRISALTGISQDQLIALNKLDTNCTLKEGQDLVIGYVESTAQAATPAPLITPTIGTPQPTPTLLNNGMAQVCILVFDDLNGDAIRQAEEPAVPDSAISLTDRLGKLSLTRNTVAGTDPVCIDDVAEGEYNISVAVPPGYNPTTTTNYALKVFAGDQAYVDFGAQSSAGPVDGAGSSGSSGTSPLLGILGFGLILGAAILGFYALRIKR